MGKDKYLSPEIKADTKETGYEHYEIMDGEHADVVQVEGSFWTKDKDTIKCHYYTSLCFGDIRWFFHEKEDAVKLALALEEATHKCEDIDHY